MKDSQPKSYLLSKNKTFSYVASILSVAAVITSTSVVNAATFNFSFSDEDGAVNGTVEGTIELPDGDGTFDATSIMVNSAPSELGYTYPLDVFVLSSIFENSFTVVDGMIDKESSLFEVEFAAGLLFGLQTSFSSGATYLTDINNSDNTIIDTGVLDSDSSTLTFSVASIESTPEPTSLLTLMGIGVLGVASKLKKKT